VSTPIWQPGHTYLPGDLVQPRSGVATVTLPTNLNFALGDTEWTKEPGWVIENLPGVTQAWRASTSTAGGSEIVSDQKVPVLAGQSIEFHAFGLTAGGNSFAVGATFYDAGGSVVGAALTPAATSDNAWMPCGGFLTVPAGATQMAMTGSATVSNTSYAVSMCDFAWNYRIPPSAVGLIYKAVQTGPGVSAPSEPTWPPTVGVTVVDNTVIWEAVQISRVVWKAVPILKSGGTEPTWPTTVGAVVNDGSVVWETITRAITDPNCPHGKVVAIAAGKVYCADGDIVRFCATANPLDWTSEADAGYLPTGLQQANANDMAVLNIYRSNVVALNPSSFQMWQVDPDPAAMAILDQMDGVGSSHQKAAQPVADDLFFLSQLGVRSVGIAASSTNLQAGDVGMPIDSLVQEALRIATLDGGVKTLATYYPGAGQYWLSFSNYPADPLAITGDLPNGFVGASVSYQYGATGGVGAHTFAITAGSLPAGLSMNSAGLVTGTRTTAGTATWTVTATDADGNTASLVDSSSALVSLLMVDSASYKWTSPTYSSYASATIDWTDGSLQPRASLNGAVVAYRKPNNDVGISRWNSGTGAFVAQTITGATPGSAGSSMNAVDVSPDGNYVVCASAQNDLVYVYHYTGSNTYALVTSYSQSNPYLVRFSPDGTQLFIGYDRSGKRVPFNTTTGAIGTAAWDVSYSGGLGNVQAHGHWVGNVIAFVISGGGSTEGVRLVNAATGAATNFMPSGSVQLGSNAFAFDGTRLAVVYDKGGPAWAVRVFSVSGTTVGTPGAEVTGLASGSLAAHFSPGGDALFLGESSVRYAYTISGTTLSSITAPSPSYNAPYLWVGFLP